MVVLAIFLTLFLFQSPDAVDGGDRPYPAGVICSIHPGDIVVLKREGGGDAYVETTVRGDMFDMPRHYFPAGRIKYLKIYEDGDVYLIDDFDVSYIPADRLLLTAPNAPGTSFDTAGVRAFANYSPAEIRDSICAG